uniref:Tc1-like transposase DDE domain-containing protein n=1 Tax=Erpetoichthys calabaricus TaxID=27687 RepID=A0A8C4RYG7_ERPCA
SIRSHNILDENLLQRPSVRKLGLRQRSWVFQQDNDPKHTSKSTQKWLKTKRWRVLKWTAMSPDLNPIEHLWRDLKIAVGRRRPSNLRNLEQFAKEEWSEIPVERCNKLVDGYRKRLISVIFSKGHATKY